MRITLIAIFVLSLGLSGCGPEPKDAYSKVANSKVELILGIQSYESDLNNLKTAGCSSCLEIVEIDSYD